MYSVKSKAKLVEGMNRAEICAHFQRKIVYLARRLAERLPDDAGITREDLASYGAIGLLEAFDLFDATQNIRFGTYAEYRIRGAMLDALRASDTLSRRRRMLARRLDETTKQLTQELGQRPKPEQVAKKMEMNLPTYWEAVNQTSSVSHLSMDDSSGDDGEEGLSLSETRVIAPENDIVERLIRDDNRQVLKDAIFSLPERQRQCVLLYYGRDMTLAEIAKVFNVTASRISQILSEARGRLKKALSTKVSPEDLAWKTPCPVEAQHLDKLTRTA